MPPGAVLKGDEETVRQDGEDSGGSGGSPAAPESRQAALDCTQAEDLLLLQREKCSKTQAPVRQGGGALVLAHLRQLGGVASGDHGQGQSRPQGWLVLRAGSWELDPGRCGCGWRAPSQCWGPSWGPASTPHQENSGLWPEVDLGNSPCVPRAGELPSVVSDVEDRAKARAA